jgi:membrane protease YdiL (CAAX protease family)
MRSNITAWIKKEPATAFFVFTFAISWISWTSMYLVTESLLVQILNHVGLFGPLFSSVIVTGVLYGRTGIKKFLARIFLWRVGVHWYLFVLFGAAVICFMAIGLYTLFGGTAPAMMLLILPVLPGALISGLREEYGWRGFALPHLMEKYSALKASVIIGVVWALWHLPISVFGMGLPMALIFLSEVIALSILLTWVYNHTCGSILLPVIHHATYNLTMYILNTPTKLPLWLIYVVLNWILVAIIIARCGAKRLSSKGIEG